MNRSRTQLRTIEQGATRGDDGLESCSTFKEPVNARGFPSDRANPEEVGIFRPDRTVQRECQCQDVPVVFVAPPKSLAGDGFKRPEYTVGDRHDQASQQPDAPEYQPLPLWIQVFAAQHSR